MPDQAKSVVVVLGSYGPSLLLFRGSLISALVRRGYRVVAMAPDIDAQLAGRLHELGAEAVSVSIANQSLNPFAMLRAVAALCRAFRRLRPDVVIAYTIKPVTLGAIASSFARVPKFVPIITGLGYAFGEGRELKRRISASMARILYRFAARRSAVVIFQNPDDQSLFRELRITSQSSFAVAVAGSGIDVSNFRPMPLPKGCIFLMIGRLLGDKGIREFGTAAARLKCKYPDAVFRLAGYFDRSPDALGQHELATIIAGGVEYLGKLEDVRPAIAAANVYVLPSYREGTPRTVLEAMAMGRPVVTTDAPGCRETVVNGENGFLVPPADAAALESAMERFILDPSLIPLMGAQSRTIAERKYDVDLVNRSIFKAAGL